MVLYFLAHSQSSCSYSLRLDIKCNCSQTWLQACKHLVLKLTPIFLSVCVCAYVRVCMCACIHVHMCTSAPLIQIAWNECDNTHTYSNPSHTHYYHQILSKYNYTIVYCIAMRVCICTSNVVALFHDAAVFSFLTGLQVNKNTTNNKIPMWTKILIATHWYTPTTTAWSLS